MLWKSYLSACNMWRMDLQYSPGYKYREGHDFWPGSKHWLHRALDRDLDIFCWCMLCLEDIQSWQHIPVCSLVGFQSSPADKYSDKYCRDSWEDCCLDHRGLDHKDPQPRQVRWLKTCEVRIQLNIRHFNINLAKFSESFNSKLGRFYLNSTTILNLCWNRKGQMSFIHFFGPNFHI